MTCQPIFDELISCSLAALERSHQNQEHLQGYFYEKFHPDRCGINDFLVDYRPDTFSILSFMSQPDIPDSEPEHEKLSYVHRTSAQLLGRLSCREPGAASLPTCNRSVGLHQAAGSQATGLDCQKLRDASLMFPHNDISANATSLEVESKQDRRRRQNRESQRRQREKRMRLDVLRSYAESSSVGAFNLWTLPT